MPFIDKMIKPALDTRCILWGFHTVALPAGEILQSDGWKVPITRHVEWGLSQPSDSKCLELHTQCGFHHLSLKELQLNQVMNLIELDRLELIPQHILLFRPNLSNLRILMTKKPGAIKLIGVLLVT